MSNAVPQGWQLKTIGDLVTLEYGKSPKEVMSDKGQYPVFGTGGLTGNATSYLYDGRTTIVGRKGTINKPSYVEGKFWAIDTTYFGTAYKGADPKWFFYSLNSFDLAKYNEASGVPSLGRETLYSIPLLTPPLPEQQKIATILSSVDNVIEATRAQIDKLKDLKTGMTQELLTKSIGSGGVPHTEFKDSPVGRIPHVWDVVRVSEIQAKSKYSCVGGPFGSDLTSKHYVEKAGVPVIRGSNLPLDFRRFIDKGFVYVSKEKADCLSKNMAYPGDLVFTQRGTLGQVGLIPDDARYERYVISQSQMKLTVDELLVNKEFLYQFFLSGIFLRALGQQTIATGLPHINLGILKSFFLPLPPMPEQVEIGATLHALDQKVGKLRAKLDAHLGLKKALMQDLLTGKVRVNVEEKEKEPAVA